MQCKAMAVYGARGLCVESKNAMRDSGVKLTYRPGMVSEFLVFSPTPRSAAGAFGASAQLLGRHNSNYRMGKENG